MDRATGLRPLLRTAPLKLVHSMTRSPGSFGLRPLLRTAPLKLDHSSPHPLPENWSPSSAEDGSIEACDGLAGLRRASASPSSAEDGSIEALCDFRGCWRRTASLRPLLRTAPLKPRQTVLDHHRQCGSPSSAEDGSIEASGLRSSVYRTAGLRPLLRTAPLKRGCVVGVGSRERVSVLC